MASKGSSSTLSSLRGHGSLILLYGPMDCEKLVLAAESKSIQLERFWEDDTDPDLDMMLQVHRENAELVKAMVFVANAKNLDKVNAAMATAREDRYKRKVWPTVYCVACDGPCPEVVADITVQYPSGLFSMTQALSAKLRLKTWPKQLCWVDVASHAEQTLQAMASERGLEAKTTKTPEEMLKYMKSIKIDETGVGAVLTCSFYQRKQAEPTTIDGFGFIAKTRKLLADSPFRPIYVIVSLAMSYKDAYKMGADVAICRDNPDLTEEERSSRGQWPKMIGDVRQMMAYQSMFFQQTAWRGEDAKDKYVCNSFGVSSENVQNVAVMLEDICRQGYKCGAVEIHQVTPSKDAQAKYERFRKSLETGNDQEVFLVHGTSPEAAESIVRTCVRPGDGKSKQLMYGPGAYFVDFLGLGKAFYFATQTVQPTEDGRRTVTGRTHGALIIFRATLGKHRFVDSLMNGDKWFNEATPMQACDHSAIGRVAAGYGGNRIIENMAEYILSNPEQQALPLAYLTFTAPTTSTGSKRAGAGFLK